VQRRTLDFASDALERSPVILLDQALVSRFRSSPRSYEPAATAEATSDQPH
jgi:uncharacterized protein (DUF924 family)